METLVKFFDINFLTFLQNKKGLKASVYLAFSLKLTTLVPVTMNTRNFVDRAYQNMEFYKDNEKVKSTFAFLKIVIDSWFSDEVE